MQLSDSALVSLYLAGQESAFALLLERHRSRAYTTILLIVRDEDVAEDLLQDAFIKAIHVLKSGRYNDEGKFGPWLCRIAHNLAIDAFRRGKRVPHHSLDADGFLANSLAHSEEGADEPWPAKKPTPACGNSSRNYPQRKKKCCLCATTAT